MIRSRATAALLRLKEIDNKYKVRYDGYKNDARSSIKAESLVSDEDTSEKTPRHSSPSGKLEILRPTLSIKIPDNCAEQLDSETSSSNELSPSPRFSTVDKTPVVTPRVVSTIDIQEDLDEDESIVEILEESKDSKASDDIERICSDKSDNENTSSALSVKNVSARNTKPNIDYSNESFESEISDAESFSSSCSPKKYSESFVESKKSGIGEKGGVSLANMEEESIASVNDKSYQLSERSMPDKTEVNVQSPIDGESRSSSTVKNLLPTEPNLKPNTDCAIVEDRRKIEDVSLQFVNQSHEQSSLSSGQLEVSNSIVNLTSDKELTTSLHAENRVHVESKVMSSKRSSVTDEGDRYQESSRFYKTTHSPRMQLEQRPDKHGYSNPRDESSIDVQTSNSSESLDVASALNANKETMHSHKKLLKIPMKSRKNSKDKPAVNSFDSGPGSKGCDAQEISECFLASSDKQPEVAPPKIVNKAVRKSQSTFEMGSSRDPLENIGNIGTKFSELRKKRVSTSGFHQRSKRKGGGLVRTSKSVRIDRYNEEGLFEYRDRELERLRARMSDLRLEQERQLMLCYMRDSVEDRRRLTLLSNQFYCPQKSEVPVIEPLDLPNVANFVKAGKFIYIPRYYVVHTSLEIF